MGRDPAGPPRAGGVPAARDASLAGRTPRKALEFGHLSVEPIYEWRMQQQFAWARSSGQDAVAARRPNDAFQAARRPEALCDLITILLSCCCERPVAPRRAAGAPSPAGDGTGGPSACRGKTVGAWRAARFPAHQRGQGVEDRPAEAASSTGEQPMACAVSADQ